MLALSVVIPTYNQAGLLARALDALAAQDAPAGSFEVVVVDDGSTDGTKALLAERARECPWLRVLSHANVGPARSRNAGMAAARGPIVAFTDSDCEPAGDWVTRMLSAFEAHPDALGIEGRTVSVPEGIGPFTHQVENESGGFYCTANIAYRRAALDAVGGFDPDYFYGHEDTDLALRVKRRGPVPFAPEVRVVHPPVPVPFAKLVTRPRVWMCQIVLFVKHPRVYRDGHRRGPFRVLLLHYGIYQLFERLYRFRAWAWREPLTFTKYVTGLVLQRLYLLAMFPAYLARYVELTRSPRASRARHEAERRFHDALYSDPQLASRPVEDLDPFNAHAFGELGDVRGRWVLDCGCGDGEITVQLARAGATVLALDISPEAVRVTRERARAAGVGDRVHAVAASFEELPLVAASADRVIGSLVLHHVDPASAGREIARVLRPAGRGAFSENFGFNPLLSFARRHLVGRFGIRRLGTVDEKPLDQADLDRFGARLAVSLEWPEFLFFQLLDRQVFRYRVRWINVLCRRLDGWIFANLPSFRRFSYRGTVVVERP